MKKQAENLSVRVNVKTEVFEAATGRPLRTFEGHNLVPLSGRDLVNRLLNGDTTDYVTHFAVGTDGTAPVSGNVALGAEIFRDLITKRSRDAGNATLLLTCVVPSTAANGSTLREAGLLNAAVGGTLFARYVHDAIEKTSLITVVHSWSVATTAA